MEEAIASKEEEVLRGLERSKGGGIAARASWSRWGEGVLNTEGVMKVGASVLLDACVGRE